MDQAEVAGCMCNQGGQSCRCARQLPSSKPCCTPCRLWLTRQTAAPVLPGRAQRGHNCEPSSSKTIAHQANCSSNSSSPRSEARWATPASVTSPMPCKNANRKERLNSDVLQKRPPGVLTRARRKSGACASLTWQQQHCHRHRKALACRHSEVSCCSLGAMAARPASPTRLHCFKFRLQVSKGSGPCTKK